MKKVIVNFKSVQIMKGLALSWGRDLVPAKVVGTNTFEIELDDEIVEALSYIDEDIDKAIQKAVEKRLEEPK